MIVPYLGWIHQTTGIRQGHNPVWGCWIPWFHFPFLITNHIENVKRNSRGMIGKVCRWNSETGLLCEGWDQNLRRASEIHASDSGNEQKVAKIFNRNNASRISRSSARLSAAGSGTRDRSAASAEAPRADG